MTKSNRTTLYVIGSLILFFALHILLNSSNQSNQVIQEQWIWESHRVANPVDLPHVEYPKKIQKVNLRKQVNLTGISYILLPGIQANRMSIEMNGDLFFQVGDLGKPTANLWNMQHIIPIPIKYQTQGVLEIEIIGIYEVGLSRVPELIKNQSTTTLPDIQNFFRNDLLLISIGGALIVGILVLSLSSLKSERQPGDVLIGMASIFAALYCFDYPFRSSTGPIWFFNLFKHLIISFGYLATLFFALSLEWTFKGRIKAGKLLCLLTGLAILTQWAIWDMSIYFLVIRFSSILLIANMLVTIFWILQNSKSSPIFLIPAVLITASIIQMNLIMMLSLPWVHATQFTILTSAIIFCIWIIQKSTFDNRIKKENHPAEQKDPLTGAFDRGKLENLNVENYSGLILMDIEEKDRPNKWLTKERQEKLLPRFAQIMKDKLRQEDLFIRWGDQEFLVLLPKATEGTELDIVKRIQRDLNNRQENITLAAGVATINGGELHDALTLADSRLIDMKENGRSLDT